MRIWCVLQLVKPFFLRFAPSKAADPAPSARWSAFSITFGSVEDLSAFMVFARRLARDISASRLKPNGPNYLCGFLVSRVCGTLEAWIVIVD